MIIQDQIDAPSEALESIMMLQDKGAASLTKSCRVGICSSARRAKDASIPDSSRRTASDEHAREVAPEGQFDDPEDVEELHEGVSQLPVSKKRKQTPCRGPRTNHSPKGDPTAPSSGSNAIGCVIQSRNDQTQEKSFQGTNQSIVTGSRCRSRPPQGEIGENIAVRAPCQPWATPGSAPRAAIDDVAPRSSIGRGAGNGLLPRGSSLVETGRENPLLAVAPSGRQVGAQPFLAHPDRRLNHSTIHEATSSTATPLPVPTPDDGRQAAAAASQPRATSQHQGFLAIPSDHLGSAVATAFPNHVLIPAQDFMLFRHLLHRVGHPPQHGMPLPVEPGSPSAGAGLGGRRKSPRTGPSAAETTHPMDVGSRGYRTSFPLLMSKLRLPQANKQRALLPIIPNMQTHAALPGDHDEFVQADDRKEYPIAFDDLEDADVLLGRGGKANFHYGNRYLRGLADENRDTYEKARKLFKRAIAMTIVKAVRDNEGRFLKEDKDDERWYEVGDHVAIAKVSQLFRTAKGTLLNEDNTSLELNASSDTSL